MYHFAWADQREKQGYKSDVSLKRGIQIICTLGKKLPRIFLLEGGKRKAHNQRSREKNVVIDIDKIVTILITTALYSK